MSDEPKNPVIARQINVNLTHKASEALDEAKELTRATATDTVNRALSVYLLVVREMEKGNEVQIKTKSNRTKVIHII